MKKFAENSASASVLPGKALVLGSTLTYVSLLVLLPLAALAGKALSLSGGEFWQAVTAPRVMASYRLSFSMALLAAAINLVFGLLLAFVLVRYRFPGRRLVDALIDLPFALPTAVAGLALCTLYSEHGWLGAALAKVGVKVAFTPLGVLVALVFVGLPFQVRSVQPLLRTALTKASEEAAATLGASAWQHFWLVLLPTLRPALFTGFTLAFARGIGEYGSVIFIAGNIPLVSEITPLLIVAKLEQYDYAGATAVALVLLLASFALLFGVGRLQRALLKGQPFASGASHG